MEYIKKKGIELFKKADVIIDGSRPWDIKVHNDKFYSRLLLNGSIALGESYMDGWWDCEAIDQFINHILKARMVDLKTGAIRNLGVPFVDKIRLIGPLLVNKQSRKQSALDIKCNYDTGNDFFEAMLDKNMQYSCGYWKDAKNLDEAQEAKLDLICRKLKLEPGMTLLDVGCGFGCLAKYAADKYGVSVTGFNNSEAQIEFAKKFCAGSDVKIIKQDYREVTGQYDRIVCIEMMEHVGYKNHRKFIKKISDCLKPGGLFLLQSISISESTIKMEPWLDKYIFPGSIALSAKQITTATEGLFYVVDWHDFTQDYHTTMMEWYKNFDKNWDSLKQNYKNSERFYRMWKYYLLCCPGTALAKTHHLWQVVFAKIDSDAKYERVCDI